MVERFLPGVFQLFFGEPYLIEGTVTQRDKGFLDPDGLLHYGADNQFAFSDFYDVDTHQDGRVVGRLDEKFVSLDGIRGCLFLGLFEFSDFDEVPDIRLGRYGRTVLE